MLLFSRGLPARGVSSGSGGLDFGCPQAKRFDLQGCTVVVVEFKIRRAKCGRHACKDLQSAVPAPMAVSIL